MEAVIFKIPRLDICPVSPHLLLVDSDFIEKCQLSFSPWRAVALATAGYCDLEGRAPLRYL